MRRVIYLKPEDEITSIVDYLWKTGQEEVVFVVPENSVFLENNIELKILKREIKRIGRDVSLVISDEQKKESAEKIGLKVSSYLPEREKTEARAAAETEDGFNEENKEDVLKEVSLEDYESLIKKEIEERRAVSPHASRGAGVKPKPLIMSDIVRRGAIGSLTKKISKKFVGEEKNNQEEPLSFFETEKESEKIGLEKEKEAKEYFEADNSFLSDESYRLDAFLDKAETPETEKEEFPINLMARKITGQRKVDDQTGASVSGKKNEPDSAANQGVFAAEQNNHPRLFKRIFIIFIGVALSIGALALYLILPKVEVVITPKSEAQKIDLTVIADKGIAKTDVDNSKISAQLIRLDQKETGEFSATGQKQLNEKAKGVITVYNEYSSASQVLVANTRFLSEGGKLFRIAKTITVPGAKIVEGKIVASAVEAEAVADQPGEEYNIGPAKFSIPGFQGSPKYNGFYGRSKEPMSGGAQGLRTVVSQEDLEKAKEKLWQVLQPKLEQEIKNQAPAELIMLDKAFKEEISQTISTVDSGAAAEKFSLTLKGNATALFFSEKDLKDLVEGKMAGRLSGGDKKLSQQTQFNYEEVRADFNKGQLYFKVQAQGKIIWSVDTEKIKKEIIGRNESEVREIFSRHSEISRAQVLFWPFWVYKVPGNIDRIEIKLERLD